MYKEMETRTSYKYLQEVIKSLTEPICILGGWAVFFHVNEQFQKRQGKPYIGSRDIDLGFHAEEKRLEHSSLVQTIAVLEEKLRFKPLSFRLLKEIHTETEEEIPEGKIIPLPFIFPMYVDLIVDVIPPNFKKVVGFNPIDEPLLRFVFEQEQYTEVKEFGKKLLLPTPELMVAMKINSLPNRDKEHKRIKDLCDLFALLWYSSPSVDIIKSREFVPEEKVVQCVKTITTEDIQQASPLLNHSAADIQRVIESLTR